MRAVPSAPSGVPLPPGRIPSARMDADATVTGSIGSKAQTKDSKRAKGTDSEAKQGGDTAKRANDAIAAARRARSLVPPPRSEAASVFDLPAGGTQSGIVE